MSAADFRGPSGPGASAPLNPGPKQPAPTATLLRGLLDSAKFDDKGLVTAVTIDEQKGDVLMVAHMDREALEKTLSTGIMTYFSRSRGRLWVKGETSGNVQRLRSVRIDCDGDAWIFAVTPEGAGAACHEGYRSCFFRRLEDGAWKVEGEPLTGAY